jgi:hypothetical protein
MDTNARTKTIHFPHLLHLIGSSLSLKMFIHYYLANNVSFFVSFLHWTQRRIKSPPLCCHFIASGKKTIEREEVKKNTDEEEEREIR